MDSDFSPAPNKTAVAFIANKKPVAAKVFYGLLPELRARAFTIAGLHGASLLQAARDAVAAIPAGSMTWDEAKAEISKQLDPYLGDGAEARSELVLRVNNYQAFSTSLYQTAQADDDTTHLQYLHGACAVPTPSHEALNGIVLPKNDPFWKTHTGPWGHLGCVCYFRPMNADQVDDEKAEDEKKAPDNRNVFEGAALKQIHHDDIVRNGRHYNISPTGPDNTGFVWHPEDLRIPLKDLEARYDPETWSNFQTWSQSTKLDDQTSVWDWLQGSEAPGMTDVPAAPAAFSSWKDAKQYADKNLHPDRLKLSDSERDALVDYQGSSIELNRALVTNATGPFIHQIKHLDSALRDKLPQETTLWHGGGTFWTGVKAGDIVQSPCYISTSFARDNSASFSEHALIKIRASKGQPGIYMDELDGYESHGQETEWLLPRDTKLKIISVEKKAGVVHIEAEIVV